MKALIVGKTQLTQNSTGWPIAEEESTRWNDFWSWNLIQATYYLQGKFPALPFADCEDLASQAAMNLILLMKQPGKVDRGDRFRTWYFLMANHLAIDLLRKEHGRRRQKKSEDGGDVGASTFGSSRNPIPLDESIHEVPDPASTEWEQSSVEKVDLELGRTLTSEQITKLLLENMEERSDKISTDEWEVLLDRHAYAGKKPKPFRQIQKERGIGVTTINKMLKSAIEKLQRAGDDIQVKKLLDLDQ